MANWPPKKVVCVGAVVLRENSVLLVRQAKGTSLEGQWSIPWGIVEADEYPQAAALRETFEEAGVTAQIVGLLGIQNLQWQCAVGIIFLCRHIAGEPQGDGGVETDCATYFSLVDLDTLEPIEEWCHWLARRVLRDEHSLILMEPQNPYRPLHAFL